MHEAKPIAAADEVNLTRLPLGGISALCHSAVAAIDEFYGPEESTFPGRPRVRRIKAPHLHEPEYARVACHPKIVEPLQDLWDPVRFDTGKLNMKSAGYGAPVEWHQDWAFYPHTNDDLAAVGIMLDDVDGERPDDGRAGQPPGPDLRSPRPGRPVLRRDGPGPRRGRHRPSRACPASARPAPLPCTMSAPCTARRPISRGSERRFLLYQYRAADAWPLLGLKEGIEKFDAQLLGWGAEPGAAPGRVPVRMPLPPAEHQGSIYENQRASGRRTSRPPPSGSAS